MSQDEAYKEKNQIKDRNVMSNLIHHLLKYLSVSGEVENEFQKIVAARKMTISFDQFKTELDRIIKDLRTYVTINHIKDLLFNESDYSREFTLVMRIIGRKFYAHNGFVSIFHSKLSTSSKNIHMKGSRSII